MVYGHVEDLPYGCSDCDQCGGWKEISQVVTWYEEVSWDTSIRHEVWLCAECFSAGGFLTP